MRRLRSVVAVGLVGVAFFASTLVADARPGSGRDNSQVGSSPSKRIKGAYIVDLKSGENVDDVSDDVAEDAGGRVAGKYKSVIGGFAFKGPDDALEELRSDPRVASVSPDYVVTTVDAPLTGSTQANHLITVGGDRAYNSSLTDPRYGASGIRIGILDTGVQANHTAFSHANVVANENVADGNCAGGSTTNGSDLNGHGTATASNAAGRVGTAHLAKIHGIKVFPGSGTSTSWSHVICGINRVKTWNNAKPTSEEIRVANLSIAGTGTSALQTAITSLVNSGVVVVAANGNAGGSTPTAPAAYAGVIGVSALNHAGTSMMSWSNDQGDITAPGENIFSANRSSSSNNVYSARSGTSRSSPIVAGGAAIALAFNPTATPAQIQTLLQQSGKCPNGSRRGTSSCVGRGSWGSNDSDGTPEPRVHVFCVGNVSTGGSDPACAGAPDSDWNRVEETGSGVAYTGTGWTTKADAGASGGSFRYARLAGNKVTFSFTGTGVRWIGQSSPFGGIATLKVDGVAAGSINMYSSGTVYKKTLFERTGLTNAAHTLEVSVTGTRSASSQSTTVYADAFERSS